MTDPAPPSHALPDHAPSASVTLDVGDGRGALIIYPAERFRGREIEISPSAEAGHRVHTGVHERGSHAGRTLTAIFGSLPAGLYLIWEDAARAIAEVRVPDGAAAEIDLS